MKITGEHRYSHPRQLVWQALLDIDVLSRILPGCEDLAQIAENQFAGKLKMKVGPVQGIFQGKVTLSDLDPEKGYQMKIEGQGAPGFMNGVGTIGLSDVEAAAGGGTLLTYELDAQVGGRIASVGQRLLESSAKVITRQGLTGLEAQLDVLGAEESNLGETPGVTAKNVDHVSETAPVAPSVRAKAPLPEAPSQAAFAAEVAKGVVADLVPPEQRKWWLIAAILIVLTAVAVGLRACG